MFILPQTLSKCWISKFNYILYVNRYKGLVNAARQVFPNIPHSKCLRHLSENFKNKYGQQISDILQHKARSYNAEEYQMYLDPLRTKEYGEEINNWIKNADPKLWCRSLFPISRFSITTSNPVEILFRALRNCRHYLALVLLFNWKLTFFQNVLWDGISLNKWKMS